MKNLAMRYIAAIISQLYIFITITNLACGGDLPKIRDPVFGLEYIPSRVHFEEAPLYIIKTCTALASDRWGRRFWVYGKTSAPNGDHFVVGGLYIRRASAVGQDDGRSAIEQDTKGAVLIINGDICTLVGPAREVFDSRPEEISDNTLKLLGIDVLQRFSVAYGSAKKLHDEMRRQKVLSKMKSSDTLNHAFEELLVHESSSSNQ